jgi:hypothetical protein
MTQRRKRDAQVVQAIPWEVIWEKAGSLPALALQPCLPPSTTELAKKPCVAQPRGSAGQAMAQKPLTSPLCRPGRAPTLGSTAGCTSPRYTPRHVRHLAGKPVAPSDVRSPPPVPLVPRALRRQAGSTPRVTPSVTTRPQNTRATAPSKGRLQSASNVLQAKSVLNHPRFYANQNPHAVMPVNRDEIFKLHMFFGQYRLQRGDQHGHYIPNAKYIFVSQMNGDVVLHPRYRHPALAEGKSVLYAGEVEFKNGELMWWSNASGNYRPDADHAGQAGLPMGFFYTHELVRAGVHRQRQPGERRRGPHHA